MAKCHPISWFKPGKKIIVNDKMQYGSYTLVAEYGKLDKDFKPELTPAQMLALGVFEGKYLCDAIAEFPKEWFPPSTLKKMSPEDPNIELNYYKIKSRLSLKEWEDRGWITKDDPNKRGWFQWYCRYYIGWRGPTDEQQIKRHRAFVRHLAQVKKNCKCTKVNSICSQNCRPRQRQALLQWAYDPRKV